MAVSSASGWKSLFWFAFGMAGLGFAGWVYLDPYMKMQRSISTRLAEVASERRKTDLARFTAAEKEKTEGDARKKATVESLATALKTGLEELGGTLMADGTVLQISFAASKLIDKNGIDVSDGGASALKIIGGAAKKEGASVRIKARSSAAAPPKELRALFHTAGEMNAVRAARMMSSLEGAGLPPGKVTIIGDSGGSAGKARGKKAAPAPDRVELELLPE